MIGDRRKGAYLELGTQVRDQRPSVETDKGNGGAIRPQELASGVRTADEVGRQAGSRGELELVRIDAVGQGDLSHGASREIRRWRSHGRGQVKKVSAGQQLQTLYSGSLSTLDSHCLWLGIREARGCANPSGFGLPFDNKHIGSTFTTLSHLEVTRSWDESQ